MSVISLIGAHDREAVQTFLNLVISAGGISEIRLLNMGNAEYYRDLVKELCLVHDFDSIHSVNLKELFVLDNQPTEILVFLNSSYKSMDDFMCVASHLITVTFDEMMAAKMTKICVLFGDNYRGLIQKAFLDKLVKSTSANTVVVESVAISSIFQISKILNSTENDAAFRCYPKIDGSLYVYPTSSLTSEQLSDLNKELEFKLKNMEKIFTEKDSSSYPNIEGTVTARFIRTYLQNDWDVACRDQELFSRSPSEEELTFYDLPSKVAVFLPPLSEDEPAEEDRLPLLVRKHLKEASEFIETNIEKWMNA